MFLLTFLIFLIGASVGSFLNVVIARYGSGQLPIRDRSACPACHHYLAWFDLVPILSFTWLRGGCRYCHRPISVRYPLIELILGLLFLIIFTPLPNTAAAWITTALITAAVCLLVALFTIDLDTFLLPDVYIVYLSVVAILWLWQMPTEVGFQIPLALLIGAGLTLLLWLATKGKGFGLGDVKLMIPLSLLFGVWGTIFLLFLAFVAGGLLGVVLLLTRKATMKTAIPFGPFLTGAAILLLLFPSLPDYFFLTLRWG